MSSSTQTTETRRGSAIVFDPEKETVSTSKVKKIEESRVAIKQAVPKWGSYVDIWVDQDDETKRVAATLNLDKLGWATNVQRAWGRFSHIYVMSTPIEAS